MHKNFTIGVLIGILGLGLLAGGSLAISETMAEKTETASSENYLQGNITMVDRNRGIEDAFNYTNGHMGPRQMVGGRNPAGSMMGGMRGYYSDTPTPISHEGAREIVRRYLESTNNTELEIGEFEEYSHNYYVSLVEREGGRGAFEIIIDRYSGGLRPEPQSMMWNGKYGTASGGMMMRGRSNNQGMMGGSSSTEMNISSTEAMDIAQGFLDVVYPGTEADEILSYYGYYTVMTVKYGDHYGMLSVNGFSGDVWYHTWHGSFISEVGGHGH
jgi:hypothetical protein